MGWGSELRIGQSLGGKPFSDGCVFVCDALVGARGAVGNGFLSQPAPTVVAGLPPWRSSGETMTCRSFSPRTPCGKERLISWFAAARHADRRQRESPDVGTVGHVFAHYTYPLSIDFAADAQSLLARPTSAVVVRSVGITGVSPRAVASQITMPKGDFDTCDVS